MGSGAHKSCQISKTGQDRTKVTITEYELIESRICAFDWHQIHRPWMTLNGVNVPLLEIEKSCGAHQKNLNEDYVTAGVPWLRNYFRLVQEFLGGQNEKKQDGLARTSCLFRSEIVLGKNEYLYQSRREESTVNVSESECGELRTGQRSELRGIAERP